MSSLPFSLRRRMVGVDRLELSTFRLSSECSNQLSYTPPIDERTELIQGREKWTRPESNRQPPACKAGVLPLNYAPEPSAFKLQVADHI